jgi:nitrogen regulatory protein PII
MKYVVAIIQPHKLLDVREALDVMGIKELVVTEIHRYGMEEQHTELYRASAYTVPYLQKTKVEFVVADYIADEVVEKVQQAATSQSVGDGRIFVLPIDYAVQIRTGKTISETHADAEDAAGGRKHA